MPVGALRLSALTLPNFCAIQILGSISQTASHQSRWADRCESTNRLNKYAKHFGFTLASASTVTIELVSSTDPYLFLMSGQGTSGTELAKNDDSGDAELGLQNSRITYAASAGTYTAEATTFGSGATGDFTITVSVASPTNAPPEFGSATYSFSVDEDEANGHTVGTVAATDSDGTVASYSLDDTSLFSISNTGVITVGASLEGQGDEPPVSLTVTATDDDGGTGTATVAITVDDVLPSEPRNVVLTPGHAQINVAWTEPDSNGGASIDGYRVRHRATTATAWRYSIIIAASPYTITSLSNGTAYNVEVQARNNLQPPEFGHWAMVDPVTPVESTLPIVDAPRAPSKTGATSSSITISWTAVTGAAKYRVRYKTGTNAWNTVEVAAGTRYTAEMLDASTTYRFEVSAYGDSTSFRAGWGAWSAYLDTATNAAPTVSGCTTSLGSISGTSTINGSWTNECVSSNRPTGRYARYFTFELATAAELTIELVSATDPYLFLMRGAGTSGTKLARNDDSRDSDFGRRNSRIVYDAAAGTYTAEATTYGPMRTDDFTIAIKAVTGNTFPGPPTNVRVIPGNNRLAVLWDPPESDGGSPIKGYRVSHEGAGSQTRGRRSVTNRPLLAASDGGEGIAGLDNGTRYSVTVIAVNANGDSAPSTSTATPRNLSISISSISPSATIQLAREADVNVETSGTVPGVHYAIDFLSDDHNKINYGGCAQTRGLVRLTGQWSTTSSITASRELQACTVGESSVKAELRIGNDHNGFFTLAETPWRLITVDDAPEGLEIDEMGTCWTTYSTSTTHRGVQSRRAPTC